MTNNTNQDNLAQQASVIALNALGWVLGEERRAQRFLDLTGLTPETLRDAIGHAGTQRAVLDFLCAHEPDLVQAAEALGMEPAELARTREYLIR